jgi:hypothetical protein
MRIPVDPLKMAGSNLHLAALIAELIEIGERADRDRLLVWYPQFCHEYPEAAGVIRECLALPADQVRGSLEKRYPMLSVLSRLSGPSWGAGFDRALQFLHKTLSERLTNEIGNHVETE